jgi:hypothetical protein
MHKSTSISIDWPTNNLSNNLRPTDKSVYGVSMFEKEKRQGFFSVYWRRYQTVFLTVISDISVQIFDD